VGPARAVLLGRLGIRTPRDLLLTLPRRYTDRSTITPIAALRPGPAATVVARVEHAAVRRRRGTGRADAVARVADATGALEVVWWGQPYLVRSLRPGSTLVLHGEVAHYRGLVMSSPEVELVEAGESDAGGDAAGVANFDRILPAYPLTEGLSQGSLRGLARRAVAALAGAVEETLPEPVRAREDLAGVGEALRGVHAPASLAEAARARRRLALDELLELMLVLGAARRGRAALPGLRQAPGQHFAAARRSLPFRLTTAQERVLTEILADMAAPAPMHRLLEGDVGSGKTVVAVLAALAAIDSGNQAAIMVPTEILASQHARTVLRLAPAARLVHLTGAATGRLRSELLAALARGDGELAIGTHALFSADVHFRRLGLVVIDEQHRFGVRERAALAGKGASPDVLVMTATPIPRSLALTVFGDLDLSVIDARPPGRRPARTHVVGTGRREGVYRFLAEVLGRGEQAFVVTPRIEADEESELVAATERVEELRQHPVLGRHPIGLLHGRLGSDEKEAVMSAFRRGDLRLLVTTTVVEVGVDVAAATVVVVEHPERFGLSQLHQLRGRVGRGERPAHCILLVAPELAPEVGERFRRFARTEDGFAVAELDLAERGPGEVFGNEQHGFGGFRLANPLREPELLEAARRLADELIAADPELAAHPALRRAVARRAGGLRLDPPRASG
jgi:ATP-dependent DNA helicase RecG